MSLLTTLTEEAALLPASLSESLYADDSVTAGSLASLPAAAESDAVSQLLSDDALLADPETSETFEEASEELSSSLSDELSDELSDDASVDFSVELLSSFTTTPQPSAQTMP